MEKFKDTPFGADGQGVPYAQLIASLPKDATFIVVDPEDEYRSYIEKLKVSAEQKCRVCGCTNDHACLGGCYWVEPDLCSRCKRLIVQRGGLIE